MKPLDEMTPEEIRLEIAERKGWEFPHEEEQVNYVSRDMAIDAGDISLEGYQIVSVYEVEGDGEPPNWSESIEAAWGLLEELQANFFRTAIFCWDHTKLHYVRCDPRSGHSEYAAPTESEADTAHLAICKAWLTWKRSEE